MVNAGNGISEMGVTEESNETNTGLVFHLSTIWKYVREFIILKVSKTQKQNCWKKLLPKMNKRICFSILTVQNYLKLEISISSFMYFRTVRIEKQIRPFIFGRNFFFVNFAFEIYWPLKGPGIRNGLTVIVDKLQCGWLSSSVFDGIKVENK